VSKQCSEVAPRRPCCSAKKLRQLWQGAAEMR